ncbi:MAG: hypothetical protein LUF85_09360, partial [Bacteroides sp.]|nr:hypothetical protein [Bacteroides sp.]
IVSGAGLLYGLGRVGVNLFTRGTAKAGILTSNGIKLQGFTKHGLNRAIERGVRPDAIKDAIQNPLKVNPVRMDDKGASQRFIGRQAEVVINPQTGQVISINPASTKK